MPGIISRKTYELDDLYKEIKPRANLLLKKWLDYPGLFDFDDLHKSISFPTEKLIPRSSNERPRVMLLCSNPHPYSVYQGMFLSPDTKGHENPFWSSMRDSGWLTFTGENHSPNQLAEICLNAEYEGPFELIFNCYYAFPTNYPEDISRIFGKEFFNQSIAPKAESELRQTINETDVKAVVTFNKSIFNLATNNKVERYINRLIDGEVIQSQISGIECSIPVFLTYPTGWHYHKEQKRLHRSSLEAIRETICQGIIQ
jgi:hypothetical protein